MKTSSINKSIAKLRTAANAATANYLGIGTLSSTTRQLVQWGEGLSELHANPDPDMTREASATAYLKKYSDTMKRAETAIQREHESLDMASAKLWQESREKAGVKVPHNAIEIRQALLQLGLKERDAALKAAIAAGRGDILGAIEDQPQFLWGGSSISLDRLSDDLSEAVYPRYGEQQEKIAQAKRTLELAAKEFTGLAEGLRDPIGENGARQAQESHQKAQAKLESAVA